MHKSSYAQVSTSEFDDADDPLPPRSTPHSSSSIRRFTIDDDVDDNDEEDANSVDPIPMRPYKTPLNYICPLTLQIMEDPVNDGCGHSFEREAILDWLERQELCPISRKPCTIHDVYPAPELKDRIQAFRNSRKRTRRNHAHTEAFGPDESETEEETNLAFEEDMEELPVLTAAGEDDAYSPIELMLLPQERRVLQMVRMRARMRARLRKVRQCKVATLVFLVALLIGAYFLIRYIQDYEEDEE